jgi:hypothetical protein
MTLTLQMSSLKLRGRTGVGYPRNVAKRLTSTLDADAIAHTIIALFHGSVLQKLWKPDIDSAAHSAVFEHFLRSLETG